MYFYHGNKHYYLTRIFLYDRELQEVVYANGITVDYDRIAYSLADQLYTSIDSFLLNDMSAEEFYDSEFNKRLNNPGYNSNFLLSIQTALNNASGKTYLWYYPTNKSLYIQVMKSFLYGSIKHFFFENKDKYLPQYDWYLINQNEKRKDIINILFREFDKLAGICDAIRYYQDIDDIPVQFMIHLQEITGLSINNYGEVLSELQIRSLTKHIIEVWREKGSLFSIELFFSCMGVDCSVDELWFDRRLYYNTKSLNEYTKSTSTRDFDFYLTPIKPHTASYEFSTETVDYSDYTGPRSSRIWKHEVDQYDSGVTEILEKLLGFEPGAEITYKFFKSNFLLINFAYTGSTKAVNKAELNVYSELLDMILPYFVRVIFGNTYDEGYGNDDWDIFKWYENSYGKNISGDITLISSEKDDKGNTVEKERSAEILYITDNPGWGFTYNGANYQMSDAYSQYLTDYRKLVSGTYINVYDTRLSNYLSCNGIEEPDTINELETSFNYDVIGGTKQTDEWHSYYPVFYNQGHEYRYGYTDGDLDTTKLVRDDGQEGSLITDITNDLSKPKDTDPVTYDTITHYYFKDNTEEIYPVLFVDDNNGIKVIFRQGGYNLTGLEDETYRPVFGPQIDWTSEDESLETFDRKYGPDETYNLFESSKWATDINAFNNLYGTVNNPTTFEGYVQYDYSEYTNPIQSMEVERAASSAELTITLI